jgi:hypothetical protein
MPFDPMEYTTMLVKVAFEPFFSLSFGKTFWGRI